MIVKATCSFYIKPLVHNLKNCQSESCTILVKIITRRHVLQIVNYSLFAIVGLIALGFSFSFVYAHTTVEVGPYEIEVGWQDEPPVVGILKAIT